MYVLICCERLYCVGTCFLEMKFIYLQGILRGAMVSSEIKMPIALPVIAVIKIQRKSPLGVWAHQKTFIHCCSPIAQWCFRQIKKQQASAFKWITGCLVLILRDCSSVNLCNLHLTSQILAPQILSGSFLLLLNINGMPVDLELQEKGAKEWKCAITHPMLTDGHQKKARTFCAEWTSCHHQEPLLATIASNEAVRWCRSHCS